MDARRDAVRIMFRLNPEKVAGAMRVKSVLRPYLNDPLKSNRNILNYGYAQLGWKFGYVTLYTDAQHLDTALESVESLIAKSGMPLEVQGKPSVVIEFRHPDAPAVVRWFERHPTKLSRVQHAKTEFGQAYQLSH